MLTIVEMHAHIVCSTTNWVHTKTKYSEVSLPLYNHPFGFVCVCVRHTAQEKYLFLFGLCEKHCSVLGFPFQLVVDFYTILMDLVCQIKTTAIGEDCHICDEIKSYPKMLKHLHNSSTQCECDVLFQTIFFSCCCCCFVLSFYLE